ncbi:MAG TPA: DUF1622 domain-containing protein [Herpetosiphonaceae bacterium]
MRRWILTLWMLLLLGLSGCSFGDLSVATEPSTVERQEPTGGAAVEERSCASVPGACATEDLLTTIVTYLTLFAELCGAFVIGVAVIRAIWRFLPYIFTGGANDEYKEDIRLQLGKSLSLALEFELGADILKTAVAPTLPIIAQLAAIIVLRTLLNYFLERELQQAERRRSDHPQPERAVPRESRA